MFFVTKKEFERRMRELVEERSLDYCRVIRDLRHEVYSGLSTARASSTFETQQLAARVAALEADAKLEAGVFDTVIFRRPPAFDSMPMFNPNPPALPLKAVVKRLLEHCGLQVKHRAATSERVEIVAKPDPIHVGFDLGAQSAINQVLRTAMKKPAPKKKGKA